MGTRTEHGDIEELIQLSNMNTRRLDVMLRMQIAIDAAKAFEAGLSSDCDGPERDAFHAATLAAQKDAP